MLKAPFCTQESDSESQIEKLYNNTEYGTNGYYLINSGNFWHSGVHINAEGINDTRTFDAVLNGKVLAYRLSEEYEKIELANFISKYKYELYPSDIKEKYQPTDENLFNYKLVDKAEIELSNNFILLKHENIIGKAKQPFVFYSLYMNLGTVKEIGNEYYDESFKNLFTIDGKIHVLKEQEQFFTSKIGCAGLNDGQRYFDFVIFTDKNLFDEKRDTNTHLIPYIREGSTVQLYVDKTDIQSTGQYSITNRSEVEVLDTKRSGSESAKLIRIKKLFFYLPADCKIEGRQVIIPKGLSRVTFNTTVFNFLTEEQAKGTAELEYTCKDLKRFSNSKGGKAVDIVFENNKLLIINGQAGIKCEIKNVPDFWIRTEESTIVFPEKGVYTLSANTVLKIYTECPVLKNFEAEGRLDKVRDVDFNAYLDKEEVIFRKIKDTDSYVKENEYMVSAFDWGKFFKNEKEKIGFSDDLFCDKTELLKKFDKRKWFDTILGNRRIISVEELYCVYGNKGKIENAEEIRSGLRKVVCTHPIEWDVSLYKDLPKVYNRKKELGMAKMSEEQASRLKKIAQKTDIWSSIKHLFGGKNNLHFVHPLYFLNHLNKAGVFEFNPYKGKTYKEIYGDTELAPGVNMSEVVKDNPGFAPVYDSSLSGRNPNINGYACVTGFFNQDYKTVHSDYKEYWHEGVDFRGPQGTAVHSLVQGTVLRCGKAVSASMGGFILIRALNDENLYYLAVHLDANTIKNYVKQGGTISPGMQVAETMLLKNSAGNNISHLHVSVIRLPHEIHFNDKNGLGAISMGKNSFPIWAKGNWHKMINPFDYNDLNTWKGREK